MNIKSINCVDIDSATLASNLTALLKLHNLNANQLAIKLGIPMMTIRRLLCGETTDPRISTLKLLAKFFNVSLDKLVAGDCRVRNTLHAQSSPHFVPILDWESAKSIDHISNLDLTEWPDWQPVSFDDSEGLSNNAFALESRPCMAPRFPQGTVFIFDQEAKAGDGDIVLVKIKANNELTLRELSIDPPDWCLHPLISTSKTYLSYSPEEHSILAVNLMTLLYNRRSFMSSK